jgi:serine phosphatase RsbU (regulator of sigma subunit)
MKADLSDRRILLVDDVKANIDVLVQALREDYKLSVATNGEDALRSASKNPPDLVLLDIMMPGMDGYEVCRRLRAAPQTEEVPVMFLSALDEMTDKTSGFEVGGNDYLTKPFEIVEVKARVRSLIKAKAYTDAIKEQIAGELRIAREIQAGFLATDITACTHGTRLDIHAVLEPAREVGGDLYEVLRTDDDRLVVVVGDVSGKAAQNPQNLFVTLFCAIFDPRTAMLTCTSAGHPSPVLMRRDEVPSLPFSSSATVAGIFPGMEVGSQTLELQPGDRLVLYTDGVTEAFNAEQAVFGETRLTDHLARERGRKAADTVTNVLKAVRDYAGDSPQSDDITVVALHYGE